MKARISLMVRLPGLTVRSLLPTLVMVKVNNFVPFKPRSPKFSAVWSRLI